MMPRIEAAETLAAMNRAALTNNVGFESDLDRQRVVGELQRKAGGGEIEQVPAREASPDELAAMGIGFVMEEQGLPSSSVAVGDQEHG